MVTVTWAKNRLARIRSTNHFFRSFGTRITMAYCAECIRLTSDVDLISDNYSSPRTTIRFPGSSVTISLGDN